MKVSAGYRKGQRVPSPCSACPGPAPTPECPRLAKGSIRRSLAPTHSAWIQTVPAGSQLLQGPSLVAADTGNAVHLLQLLRAPLPSIQKLFNSITTGHLPLHLQDHVCPASLGKACAPCICLPCICLPRVCLFCPYQTIKPPSSSEMCARQMGGTVLNWFKFAVF